jgi:NADH-quinone oxidoreductase subunit H
MIRNWLSFLPGPLPDIALALFVGGAILNFIAVSALFFIWLERKVAGRMQDRLGPTRVGGRFGWLQTIADGIKLLMKEDTIPTGADAPLFRLAPYIAFCASYVSFIALPFGAELVGQELQVAAYFILAVLSGEVFGVILAGYSSSNKWSLFGGIREAAQVVSYEVPRGICVLIPVLISGTLNLNQIGRHQEGFFVNWNLFHDPFSFLAFWIFFICATAGCKRAPFDLAEAESELVAGFHTEYSGLRWSFFFMAEYASMFAVSGIATLLYLGGWHCGFLNFEPSEQFGLAGDLLDLVIFVLKCWVLVFVMMWMRWSLPRLRIDQVMMTCLQYFLPISCGLLIFVSLWQLFVPAEVGRVWKYLSSIGCIVGIVMLLFKVTTTLKIAPRGKLDGAWQGQPTPLSRSV